MSFLGTSFNESNAVENTSNFEPIKAGWYQAQIKSAELKPTKDGTGKYLNLRYDILGPTNAGRVIFGMITIENQSDKAMAMGYGQMTELRIALGLREIANTEDIEGLTLEIKVSINNNKKYNDKNGVKSFKSIAGSQMPKVNQPSHDGQSQQNTPPQSLHAQNTPVWAQKKAVPVAESIPDPAGGKNLEIF